MKRLRLFLVLLLAIILSPNAYALTAKADNNVIYNQNTNDNALFAGNSVDINSEINGLGLVAGNSVTVKGKTDYGFIAGNSINVSNYETKDLFVAGENITVSNAKLRSIYAAGNVITINTDATSLYIGGNKVYLTGNYDTVYIDAEELTLKGEIKGKLFINEKCKVNTDATSKIAVTETHKDIKVDEKDIATKFIFVAIVGKIISKVMHFLSILVIGLIFIALFKKTVKRISETKGGAGYVFTKFGIGLLALIVVPIASLLVMITVIGLPLGVISLILYGLAIYLGEIIGTLYVGKLLFPHMNNYLRYFLVLLILSTLSIIPIIGGLLSFFMLCLNLGLILDLIYTEIKGK